MADIRIGKIVNAHGIKGEVKLISYSDDPDRFEMLESIIVKGPAGDRADAVSEYFIEDVRYKAGSIILKLEGVDDRNAAEAMKGSFVYMDEEDLPVRGGIPEDHGGPARRGCAAHRRPAPSGENLR